MKIFSSEGSIYKLSPTRPIFSLSPSLHCLALSCIALLYLQHVHHHFIIHSSLSLSLSLKLLGYEEIIIDAIPYGSKTSVKVRYPTVQYPLTTSPFSFILLNSFAFFFQFFSLFHYLRFSFFFLPFLAFLSFALFRHYSVHFHDILIMIIIIVIN